MTETNRPQCVARIEADGAIRQCRRTATHVYPNDERVASCSQHARYCDVPMPKAAR